MLLVWIFDDLIKVYMEGEFVGGCDILLQMHQNGELGKRINRLLKKKFCKDK